MENDKKKPAWKMRLSIIACALTITGILGAMTPEPTPSGQSNAILLGFTLSLMFSLVTVIAMIPAPRDPRRRRRRDEPQQGTSSPDQVVARYTNPSPFQPMLKERDDSRPNGR